MDTLRRFLRDTDHAGIAALAEAAGTKPVYLRQIAGGHRLASHKLARRLERASCGRITAADLRPDIYGDPS